MNSKWLKRAGLLILVVLLSLSLTGQVQAAISWGKPIKVMEDGGGGVGPASLSVINGNPAIGFVGFRTMVYATVVYVRAKDARGMTWGAPQYLDGNNGHMVMNTSLAVVNGNPAISYQATRSSKTDIIIKYIRALDANGTNWNPPVTVASDVSFGDGSLAVVNGNPALTYVGFSTGDLMYVRAKDANGTTWATPVTIEYGGGNGHVSLTIVNGDPAISYMGPSGLKYVRSMDINGTVWGPPITVDSIGNGSPSLDVVNGNPAISYFDTAIGDYNNLRYVRAMDANGTAWGLPQRLDSALFWGETPSLAVVNGYPAIGYHDMSNLKYMMATDLNGLGWEPPQILVSGQLNRGEYMQENSLLMVNGSPAITYIGGPESGLMYLRAKDATLPTTGFALGRITTLPGQTASYSDLGDLWLEIPRLGVQASIVGVPQSSDGGWDVSWLGDDAGWLNGTAFPTHAGNSVLTGHVYDADGQPGPFVHLNGLWWGDQVIVHAWGQAYVYAVREVRQVTPDAVSAVITHEEYPWLTLVTCRGYDQASNSYQYRVVVRAVQVEIR